MTPLEEHPGWAELVKWADEVREAEKDLMCSIPGCAYPKLARGLCERHYRQARCGREEQPQAESMLIPEDGIVDQVAIEIASEGARPVRMTRRERRKAAKVIVSRGGDATMIAERLGVHHDTAGILVRWAMKELRGWDK